MCACVRVSVVKCDGWLTTQSHGKRIASGLSEFAYQFNARAPSRSRFLGVPMKASTRTHLLRTRRECVHVNVVQCDGWLTTQSHGKRISNHKGCLPEFFFNLHTIPTHALHSPSHPRFLGVPMKACTRTHLKAPVKKGVKTLFNFREKIVRHFALEQKIRVSIITQAQKRGRYY